MSLQDVARLTLTALRSDKSERKVMTFAGPRAWTTQEVMSICAAFQDTLWYSVVLHIHNAHWIYYEVTSCKWMPWYSLSMPLAWVFGLQLEAWNIELKIQEKTKVQIPISDD
jgi:hypothetical protein